MPSSSELVDIKKQLEKPGVTPARLLSLLNELKGLTGLTKELLAKTQIGKTVGKLRKHENPEVQNAAKAVVTKWKSLLMTSSTPSPSVSKRNGAENGKDLSMPSLPATSSLTKVPPSPLNGSAESNKLSVPSSSSGHVLSKSDPQPSTEPLDPRDRVKAQLMKSLAVHGIDPSQGLTMDMIAGEIEDAIYNKVGGNMKDRQYGNKVRSLSFNIKSNYDLSKGILMGIIKGDDLVNMTADELATKERRSEIEKYKKEQKDKIITGISPEDLAKAKDGMFQCRLCKKKKTTFYQLQTRSADEPMTNFVTCLTCGNHWRC